MLSVERITNSSKKIVHQLHSGIYRLLGYTRMNEESINSGMQSRTVSLVVVASSFGVTILVRRMELLTFPSYIATIYLNGEHSKCVLYHLVKLLYIIYTHPLIFFSSSSLSTINISFNALLFLLSAIFLPQENSRNIKK